MNFLSTRTYQDSLIGRDRDIESLQSALGASSVVTITGPRGFGKTRLAVEFARRTAADFPDGMFGVTLETAASGPVVLEALALSFGIRESSDRPLLELLAKSVGSKRILFVLDGCNEVTESCAQLAESLTRTCPDLRILTTSDTPLGISRESVYPLPALAVPDSMHSHSEEQFSNLAGCESVRLFVDRGRNWRKDFALDRSNTKAVAALCRALEGIPLAIELAAAWVGRLDADSILEQVRFRLTDATPVGAMVAWSVDSLDASEQCLLRKLDVFKGSWTVAAAESVCCDDEVGRERLRHLLGKATHMFLTLEERYSPRDQRYRFAEGFADYAADPTADVEQNEPLLRRYVKYYARQLRQAEAQQRGPQQKVWLEWIEAERENIKRALEWASANEPALAVEMIAAAWWFWLVHGYLRDARKFLELCLLQDTAPSLQRARALQGIGAMDGLLHRHEEALEHDAASLEIYEALKERIEKGIADVKHQKGIHLADLHRFSEARSLLADGLALRRTLEDWMGVAASLGALGIVASEEGDYEEAIRYHKEALAIRIRIDDRRGEAVSLHSMGVVNTWRKKYSEALALLLKSLSRRRELGEKRSLPHSFEAVAEVAIETGHASRAARLLSAAETLRDEFGMHELPNAQTRLVQMRQRLLTMLSDRFHHEWGEGSRMSTEQAIAFALQPFLVVPSATDILRDDR